MPTYHVECACGARLSVELTQAGTSIQCPSCQDKVTVPRVSELKRRAGDEAPHLGNLEKFMRAMEEGTTPFDGRCQSCGKLPACVQRPVTFEFLVKRQILGREGIQSSLNSSGPGVSLVVGVTDEDWRTVRFPLLLCTTCHDTFMQAYARSGYANFGKKVVIVVALVPIAVGLVALTIAMPCVSAPALIMIFIMAIRHRSRKSINPFMLSALQQIPFIGDAISAEGEYHVCVAAPRPYAHAGKIGPA